MGTSLADSLIAMRPLEYRSEIHNNQLVQLAFISPFFHYFGPIPAFAKSQAWRLAFWRRFQGFKGRHWIREIDGWVKSYRGLTWPNQLNQWDMTMGVEDRSDKWWVNH